MQMGFYFDQARCSGCNACAVACKDWNDVPPGPASWRRVLTQEKGEYPQVSVTHLVLSCLHCARPSCIPACPTEAISKRERDGIVVVDQGKCLPGCEVCRAACPYDAPQFRAGDQARMEMCDLCLDRLEEGKKPICVGACPLRALDSGPLEELAEKYGGVRTLEGFHDPSQTGPSIVFQSVKPSHR